MNVGSWASVTYLCYVTVLMSSNKDKDVPMVNGALFFVLAYGRTDGGTYVHTDSHVTTKSFEINGLPNFLRYGVPTQELHCKKSQQ